MFVSTQNLNTQIAEVGFLLEWVKYGYLLKM